MGHVRIYEYDPWGKCTIASDTSENNLGKLNPFRYRGYYYDEETSLYYLQSRYYDYNTCKFINADDPSILLVDPYNVQCVHIYDYCENSPVINIDPTGYKMQIYGSSNRTTFLNLLQELTSHELKVNDDGYVSIKKYRRSFKYEYGDRLIKTIIDSKYLCTITNATINQCDPRDDFTCSLMSRGCGSYIFINLKGKVNLKTIDPKTGIVSKNGCKKTPTSIVLAHELIHAYRNIRGRHITGTKKVKYRYKSSRSIKYMGRYKFKCVSNYTTAYSTKEELATIGLGYNKSGDITENQIRKEHGLWLRGAY